MVDPEKVASLDGRVSGVEEAVGRLSTTLDSSVAGIYTHIDRKFKEVMDELRTRSNENRPPSVWQLIAFGFTLFFSISTLCATIFGAVLYINTLTNRPFKEHVQQVDERVQVNRAYVDEFIYERGRQDAALHYLEKEIDNLRGVYHGKK